MILRNRVKNQLVKKIFCHSEKNYGYFGMVINQKNSLKNWFIPSYGKQIFPEPGKINYLTKHEPFSTRHLTISLKGNARIFQIFLDANIRPHRLGLNKINFHIILRFVGIYLGRDLCDLESGLFSRLMVLKNHSKKHHICHSPFNTSCMENPMFAPQLTFVIILQCENYLKTTFIQPLLLGRLPFQSFWRLMALQQR